MTWRESEKFLRRWRLEGKGRGFFKEVVMGESIGGFSMGEKKKKAREEEKKGIGRGGERWGGEVR